MASVLLNSGGNLQLHQGGKLLLAPITLPEAAYWIIADFRDENHPTGVKEALKEGYQSLLNRLSSRVALQEPLGVIFRNPGPSTSGGYSLDGFWVAENVQPLVPAIVENLLDFNYWELDREIPVPRRPGGGRFPIWFWTGPFSQRLRDEWDEFPAATELKVVDCVRNLWHYGVEGIVFDNASDPNIPEDSDEARFLDWHNKTQRETTAISGWPRTSQRHLRGMPVLLEWADRSQHPLWDGHDSEDAMDLADVGEVLIVVDSEATTLYENCEEIIAVGATIGLPEEVWGGSFLPPAPSELPTFQAVLSSVTIGNTSMVLPSLTSINEMKQVLGDAGYDLAIEDRSGGVGTDAAVTACIDEATEHVYTYMSARYTTASISTAPMLRRYATYGALFFLSARRNNPASDTYGDLWNRALEMLKALSIGEMANLKPPGLEEHERSSFAVINFDNQPGPTPFGEPARYSPGGSTNEFPGARARRVGQSWGIGQIDG